jgi:sec-independent protein translocase protein TatC
MWRRRKEIAGKPMLLMSHLGELRSRVIRSAIAIGVGAAAAFYWSDDIMRWLMGRAGVELVFLTPAEAFWVSLKVALLVGLFLALPVVFYHIWRFVSPGLLPKERRYGVGFIVLSTTLFLVGTTFCMSVVLPFGLKFLFSYGEEMGLKAMISVNAYIDFVIKFLLAFGLIFELPLVITLLARLGLTTPEFLARHRKFAVLLAFIVAAILTPTPDIFNQLLMAGPLILLYEVGIWSARLFGRARKTADGG